jgi:hypothetical protein
VHGVENEKKRKKKEHDSDPFETGACLAVPRDKIAVYQQFEKHAVAVKNRLSERKIGHYVSS